MKRLAIAAVILLAAGCQSPDARLAKENADLKAQREDLILYVQSLQRERLWLHGQIDDLIRELERANGRRIF